MGKRSAATSQHPEILQQPQRRWKKTPDDAAAVGASASGVRSSGTRRLWHQPKKTKSDDAAPGSAKSQAEQEHDAAPHRTRTQAEEPPMRRLLRSCATATAPARLHRGRAVSVSWRAKRRRTVRSGPALPGSSRWRDWAGLDEGPAGLIAERVLANDVADYVRFRATCLPWRRCCTDPRARGVLEDPRLFPRHWIMLHDDYAAHRRFLDTRTGRCFQVDVPELQDHEVLRGTADGLLVLHCETSKVVRLLNPLTRQAAELPPTTGLVEEDRTPWRAGLLDNGTVYLYFYDDNAGTMAIVRPGDDRWALLDAGRELIMPTVFFAGRFYGVTYSGIVTVDMAGDGDDRGPRLVVAAELPKPFTFQPMTDSAHLVDNGDGDLRLVHRMLRTIRDSGDHKRMYRVYRVNFSTGKTTTRGRRNLGGRAIFIGFYSGLSVSPRVFPFLSADTIYPGLHSGDSGRAYHVRDGSIEILCNDDSRGRRSACPLSIADSLIAHVSC